MRCRMPHLPGCAVRGWGSCSRHSTCCRSIRCGTILLPLLLDKREPDEEYLALLTRQLGLTALLQRQPTQLSGGQQQRAAIARALITRPAVVLADEPTGNLDHQNSVEVFRLLREAAAQQHQTVVYVTHDQGLAAQADRVLRMQDGRIEEA